MRTSTRLAVGAMLAGCLALFAAVPGCSDSQLATAKTDLATIQKEYVAATQAVQDTQAAVTATGDQIALAKAQATTMPVGPQRDAALAAVAKIQQAADAAQTGLAQAKAHEAQVQAALDTASNLIVSMQTGTAPNVSPLTAIGPWGVIVGLAITTAWGVFQGVKSSGLQQQVALLVSSLGLHKAALVATAGTSDPATALAKAPAADASTLAAVSAHTA